MYQLLVLLYLLVTRVKYTEFVGSVCVLHFVFFLVCFVRGWVSHWFCTVFSIVDVIQNLVFRSLLRSWNYGQLAIGSFELAM